MVSPSPYRKQVFLPLLSLRGGTQNDWGQKQTDAGESWPVRSGWAPGGWWHQSSSLSRLSSLSPGVRQTTIGPFGRAVCLDPRLQVMISVPLISWQVMIQVQTLPLPLRQETLSYVNTIILGNIGTCSINISLNLASCVFFFLIWYDNGLTNARAVS